MSYSKPTESIGPSTADALFADTPAGTIDAPASLTNSEKSVGGIADEPLSSSVWNKLWRLADHWIRWLYQTWSVQHSDAGAHTTMTVIGTEGSPSPKLKVIARASDGTAQEHFRVQRKDASSGLSVYEDRAQADTLRVTSELSATLLSSSGQSSTDTITIRPSDATLAVVRIQNATAAAVVVDVHGQIGASGDIITQADLQVVGDGTVQGDLSAHNATIADTLSAAVVDAEEVQADLITYTGPAVMRQVEAGQMIPSLVNEGPTYFDVDLTEGYGAFDVADNMPRYTRISGVPWRPGDTITTIKIVGDRTAADGQILMELRSQSSGSSQFQFDSTTVGTGTDVSITFSGLTLTIPANGYPWLLFTWMNGNMAKGIRLKRVEFTLQPATLSR